MNHFRRSRVQEVFAWLKVRVEIVVPFLGVIIFRAMLAERDVSLSSAQTILVYCLAAIYTALVLYSPMSLPAKTPRPGTKAEWKPVALRVFILVLAGFGIMTILTLTSDGATDENKLGLSGAVIALLLITGAGTVGIIAERRLPIDLFPVYQRHELRRIIYVFVSALFLVLLDKVFVSIFSDLTSGIGTALGETPPVDSEAAAYFEVGNPLRLFLNFLIGAGLFEELLFRVGIMTPVWMLTRRWGWGLLISSLAFGLYHISPLSSMAAINMQAPLTAVLESFGAGLSIGLIYKYRGFTTAIMTHAFGNWLVVMFIMS